MSDYSYVSLTGGLGNQLFQYFFALSIHEIFKTTVKIDDSRQTKFLEHPNSKLTKSGLIPDYPPVEYATKPPERLLRAIDYGIRRVLKDNWISSGETLACTPMGTCYETATTDPNKILASTTFRPARRYVGYFQSSEYFDSLKEEVKKQFLKRAVQKAEGTGVLHGDLPVAIHVRRGDYRLRNDFLLLGPEYYLRALDELGASGKNGIVLSDEPKAKDVKEIAKLTGLELATDIYPAETVGLLASAKSLVIANSSLSFASGLIGNVGNISVAAPLGWRSPNFTSNRVMNYPKNWIRVRA